MQTIILVTFNYNEIKSTWTYRHDAENVGELDSAFPLANYILSAFDAREIAPTSNNKQVKSHVAVSIEMVNCRNLDGKNLKAAVFDLAGVENVFKCERII